MLKSLCVQIIRVNMVSHCRVRFLTTNGNDNKENLQVVCLAVSLYVPRTWDHPCTFWQSVLVH